MVGYPVIQENPTSIAGIVLPLATANGSGILTDYSGQLEIGTLL